MNKVPKLRFKEFSGTWEEKKCSNLFDKIRNGVDVEEDNSYKQIGIRSHGKGIFYKDEVTGKELGNKRVFWVEPDVFIVNIVFAWERAVAKTTENEIGMIASHRFPMYKPKEEILDLDYITYFFKTNKGKALLELASPGGAGRNKTLGQKEFDNLKIILPKVEEQKKIGSILSLMDKKIEKQQEKVEAFKDYKKGMMQKIFSREIMFKGDNGEEYSEWEEKKLSEVSKYTSSNVSMISLEEFNGEKKYPIYNANQIYMYIDKFDSKEPYISIIKDGAGVGRLFLCEAKSSVIGTMGYIKPSNNCLLGFLYYRLQLINFIKYINGSTIPHVYYKDYKHAILYLPCLEEQQKIANFLFTLDKKLKKEQEKLDSLNQWKKGLLQQMFV